MLNFTTREKGYPAAVLLRGVEGVEGPGRTTRHFQINSRHNEQVLSRVNGLWVEDDGYEICAESIQRAPRVGIDYAGAEWRRVLEALKSPPAIVSKGDVHIGFNPIYEYSALPDHERVVNAIESILGTALKSSLEAAKWSEQLDAPAAPIQTPAGEAEPTMNSALSMDQKMK